MTAAGEAQARAKRLLAAHLTESQRAEYAVTGKISIVKRGFVWGILLRQALVALPFAPLIALPPSRTIGLVLFAAVAIALAPFWVSRARLAAMRRRRWVLSPRSAPMLLVQGRSIRFCVRFTEDLPPEDRVLAWKNLIERSEAHFLKTANAL